MDLMMNNWIATLMLSDHPAVLLAQAGVRSGGKVPPIVKTQPNFLVFALLTLLTSAIAFYLLSFLPIVEIDTPVTAIICAVVFGALNIVSQPIENALGWTLVLSPISFLINALMFWITDLVIGGFKIKNGVIGILLGSLALTIVQSVLRKVLNIA
jgi:putative membrane protein